MTHANSLRVIGQSLEVAKLPVFELETDGENYIVRSDFLTKTGEWILRHAVRTSDLSSGQSTTRRSVRFSPNDIARLNDQAQKQRTHNPSLGAGAYGRLSQLLRTLGDHLDRTQVRAFRFSWTSQTVLVDFQSLEGQSDSRTFTPEKLQELGSHLRFRRSSRPRPDSNAPGFLPPPTRPRTR